MQPEKLSDEQVYLLSTSDQLTGDLKRMILQEFRKRNFSEDYLDQLDLITRKSNSKQPKDLSVITKIALIVFPFLILLQAILANRYLSKGHEKLWRKYWNFVSLGFLFWTIIVILVAKYKL